MKRFDYVVIGAGSGGIASARRAAQYGAKVAIIESARLGGTCVNVGCVPKKVTWTAASLFEQLHDLPHYGIDVEMKSAELRYADFVRSRDAYVARLNGIYQKNLEGSGVALFRGKGHFVGPKEVQVDDGEVITADHVLIATGGRPEVPNVPGAELGITSDGFFELKELPRRVVIVVRVFCWALCLLSYFVIATGSGIHCCRAGRNIQRSRLRDAHCDASRVCASHF